MRVKTKLSLLVTLAIVAACGIILFMTKQNIEHSAMQESEQLRENRLAEVKRELAQRVNTVFSLIEARYRETLAQNPSFSDEQIKTALLPVLEDIRRIRFEQEYFWIHDNTIPIPKMVMHPIIPSLDGTVLDSREFMVQVEKKEQNAFVIMRDIAVTQGEGFAQYSWPKPTQSGPTASLFPKVSFVKFFKPLGWVIGTGEYIDNIDKSVQKKVEAAAMQVNYLVSRIVLISISVVLAATILANLLALTITRPLEKLEKLTSDFSVNENSLARGIALKASGEVGKLAVAFNQMASRVNNTVAKMREQRELLNGVLSHLPHAIFWKDRSGHYLGCNDAFVTLLSLPNAEFLVGKTDKDFLKDEMEAVRIFELEKNIIQNGSKYEKLEQLNYASLKGEHQYLVNRLPLLDQAGNIIGILGILVKLNFEQRA